VVVNEHIELSFQTTVLAFFVKDTRPDLLIGKKRGG